MEKFNPSDPQYKSVEDLPEAEKGNYANLPDGGFVKKEVLQSNTEFEEDAIRRRNEAKSKRSGLYEPYLSSISEKEELTLTAEQVAHEKALFENEFRKRTAEEIENFNINEDGLAIHGTLLNRLEKILKEGLGPVSKSNREIDFHVVGTPGIGGKYDERHEGLMGFGEDRLKYGGRYFLVTDIFKRIWPNFINAIVKKSHRVSDCTEQLVVYCNKEDEGIGVGSGMINNDLNFDWIDGEEIFHGVTEEKVEHPLDWPTTFEMKGVDRQEFKFNFLDHWAFKAIVIPNNPLYKLTPEESTKAIIEIQNKVLPKEEHIPIYNESGECLYNPLK